MPVYCSRALSSPRYRGGSCAICTGPASNNYYAKVPNLGGGGHTSPTNLKLGGESPPSPLPPPVSYVYALVDVLY